MKTRVLNEESRKVGEASSSSHSEALVTQSMERSKSRGPGKGRKDVGANQEASMRIMSDITAIRMATLSDNMTSGRKTKRKKKIRRRLTVIVT